MRSGDLHEAAFNGDSEAVARLLDQGVDPNIADEDTGKYEGSTALHFAARQGRLEVARVLLDKGADPEVENLSNATPLAVALYTNKPDTIEVASLLAARGCSLDGKGSKGAQGTRPWKSLLHASAQRGNADDLRIARWLLDHGADLESTDEQGLAALHYAAFMGSVPMVELLLAAGARTRVTALSMMDRLKAQLGASSSKEIEQKTEAAASRRADPGSRKEVPRSMDKD